MTDITCGTALERMLEAEPAELRGEAESDLARHIAGCERCAAVATAFLEEHEALDDAMARLAMAPARLDPDTGLGAATDLTADLAADLAADAAADEALAAVREAEGRDVVPLDRRRESRTWRTTRWTRAAWIPLAAAAALAAVIVFRQGDRLPGPMGPTGGSAGIEEPLEPRVAVTPPADKSAAIMETENPNITIVWLYEREGT